MFASTNWVGFAAALVLILLSLAAVFFSGHLSRLPPISDARIEPGFVGQQKFGLWTLICENVVAPGATAPTRLCRSNARMTVRGPNNTPLLAAGFNIVMMKSQPSAGMLFRLPPTAAAADTASFSIDKNSLFKAPLKCSQTECLAQGALPKEAIEQMRAGQTLSLIYTIKDREQKPRQVRVDQLLHGFRQSYDAMTRAITG